MALRRVVVNLSPGTLRKEGPGLDLPVAMGVLTATAQVPMARLEGWAFAGELSLRGELVPTPGMLSLAIGASCAGRKISPPRGKLGRPAVTQKRGISIAPHAAAKPPSRP